MRDLNYRSEKNCVIIPKDFYIFGKDLSDSLKRLFPFESLSFLIGSIYDLDSLLGKVNISERQRQRALASLKDEEPFWDRVQHQVFIPLDCLRSPFLAVAHLKNVPKNIGAEEDKWFVKLIKFFLLKSLSEFKFASLEGGDTYLPRYFYKLLDCSKNQKAFLLFLRTGSSPLNSHELIDIFSMFFDKEIFELVAAINSSYWFLFKKLSDHDDNDLLKKIAIFLSKKYSLKNFLFFKFDEIKQVENSFLLASILKSRVLSSSFIEKISNETGVDLLKLVSVDTEKANALALVRFSSLEKKPAIKECLLKKGAVLFPVGADSFICKFSKQTFFLDKDTYLDKFKSLYLSLKEIDNKLIVGFSCVFQSGITHKSILAYTFISFYHAFLLGPGNYAVFDALSSNVYGDLLYSFGDIKGAITAYKHGLRLKKDDINLLNSLGTLYAELGRLSLAENFFLQAITKDPKNVMALYNLSGIYWRKGRFDNALNKIEKALEIEPNDPALLVRKLEILLDSKDFTSAYGFSQVILAKDIKKPLSLSFLCAQALIFKDDWHTAKEILKEILKKNSSYYAALLFLAYGFWKFEKDKNTAIRFIKKIDAKKINNKRYNMILNKVIRGINRSV